VVDEPLYLVDTSIWIPFLRDQRRSAPLTVLRQRGGDLIAQDLVTTTGMIRLEVLRGTRPSSRFGEIRALLDAVHQLPWEDALWDDAAMLGNQLLDQGIVARATELIIVATAVRTGSIVVHRDSDFELIAQHTGLKPESHL